MAAANAAYCGVLLVCVNVLGDPSSPDRPLAEVGRQLFGTAGAAAASVGAMTVIVGATLATMVAMPRMLLAISDQGQLPAVLGAVDPRWRTPRVAILASSPLTFGLAIFRDLLSNLSFSTASRVLCYILCCGPLWRLSRPADVPSAKFHLPGRRLAAAASAIFFTVVLTTGATKQLPILGVALAVGLVLFAATALRPPTTRQPVRSRG